MSIERGPRLPEDDGVPIIRLRPRKISPDGNDIPTALNNNSEREETFGPESIEEDPSEKSISEALSAVEDKTEGDPIVKSAWMEKAGDWFSGKWEKWTEDIRNPREWVEEEFNKEKIKKDTVEAGRTSFALGRIGLFTVFKIMWGLVKFSYQAIMNKGNVKDAYKIGQEMFTNDKEGKK